MERVEIESQVMLYLDRVIDLKLELSEDDSVYTLPYLREKLTTCSRQLELASDIGMALTKIQIELRRLVSSKSGLVSIKTMEWRATEEYLKQPSAIRTAWLSQKVMKEHIDFVEWESSLKMVLEVKEAVSEKMTILKRLDSDLRLQTKLLEMAPPEAQGPTGEWEPGAEVEELNIS